MAAQNPHQAHICQTAVWLHCPLLCYITGFVLLYILAQLLAQLFLLKANDVCLSSAMLLHQDIQLYDMQRCLVCCNQANMCYTQL